MNIKTKRVDIEPVHVICESLQVFLLLQTEKVN